MANIKAQVEQLNVDVLGDDTLQYAKMSKIGQLWTANWKYRLAAAGKCYRMSWGTISGGTDITLGGDATSGIDLDQPEGIVSVQDGYLIPIELEISGTSDIDAAGDDVQVLVTADRATAITTGGGTAETPDNLLDGAPAFGGYAATLATSDVTDPVHSDVLFYRIWTNLVAEGTASNVGPFADNLYAQKAWDYPNFIKGPCAILIYAAGEVAFTFAGSFVFAHIPVTWAPTS